MPTSITNLLVDGDSIDHNIRSDINTHLQSAVQHNQLKSGIIHLVRDDYGKILIDK